MQKATIKLLLSACRPGDRRDAADPILAEALAEAARDPELSAWLEDERHFDALMVRALKDAAAAPAGLKELILLNARAAAADPALVDSPAAAPLAAGPALPDARRPARDWRRHVPAWLALAACLMLAFLLGRETLPRPIAVPTAGGGRGDGSPRGEPSAAAAADRLALQAIDYTGRMPALQFVCFDAAEVARWINQKSAALNMGKVINQPMPDMRMIGSSAAQWNGKPVVMIALQNGDRMAMLYLVRAADFAGADAPDAATDTGAPATGRIMEKDGFVTRTWRRGEHLYVLTARGKRADLDFPVPL